jgi:DNA-binding transcriptional ArsR family regulator
VVLIARNTASASASMLQAIVMSGTRPPVRLTSWFTLSRVVYHRGVPSSTAVATAPAADDHLDLVFRALGDRTRRAILRRLSADTATVSELARPFGMSLPGVSKHITVLEQAGLVTRTVEGRVRRCTFQPDALRDANAWIAEYQQYWESTLESLADYLGPET